MMVKWKNVFRLYEYLQPHLKVSKPVEEKPVGPRVMVLSPHIDDDILGAGGTLYKHHLAGDKIVSVYLASLNDKEIRQKEGETASEIIGSNIQSISEIIEPNKNGLLFETGNPKDLSTKISCLLMDERMQTELGTKGRETVKERFSIENTIIATEQMYYKVISE